MQQLVIKIERKFSDKTFWQEYSLDFQPNKSVFWWLNKISEQLDRTLAFECSCNAGLCGACAVMVNNQAVLSCKELINCTEQLTIKPLANLPISKDLVIDWRDVDSRLREHTAWLFVDYNPTTDEYIMDSEVTALDKQLAGCINCGICVAVCPVFGKGGFEYPFVFCKGQRLMIDSNVPQQVQQQVKANLNMKAEKCIDCGACARNCPKGVDPAASIAVFR